MASELIKLFESAVVRVSLIAVEFLAKVLLIIQRLSSRLEPDFVSTSTGSSELISFCWLNKGKHVRIF